MGVSIEVRFPKRATGPVPVRVNETVIPRDAIVHELQHHPSSLLDDAWKNAIRALVVRELLLQRARVLGVVAQPQSDAEGRRETDDEAIIRAVIEREVPVPQPDEDTCRRYYENNSARFRSPDLYEAAHILFAAVPSDKEAYARARADAEAVLCSLKSDPNSFEALARTHSHCPSAELGGNLGQLVRGQTTQEFEQALTALEPGEISAVPVATRYGFHIIRLDRKHAGAVLPFDAVAERVACYLCDSVCRRAQAQYIARLASSARIEGITIPDAQALRVH